MGNQLARLGPVRNGSARLGRLRLPRRRIVWPHHALLRSTGATRYALLFALSPGSRRSLGVPQPLRSAFMANDEQARTPSDGTDRPLTELASGPEDPFLGRMNDPSGSAFVRGACGDEMEFYLDIRDDVIRQAKYYTEGCDDTRRYGRAVAMAAQGKALLDALALSPRQVMDEDRSLTEGSRHCAILAVIALYRAIADYLIQP